MTRRCFAAIAATLTTALLFVGCTPTNEAPTASLEPTSNTATPAEPTKKLVIGFSQIGAESGWRTANTKSIQDEAKKRGHDLKFSDAQGDQENQIKAIRSFIAQGVDVIAFAPVVETGWGPVLKEAKAAGIPVICSDRSPTFADDLFVTFIGSDFVKEGEMAAEWMLKNVKGPVKIAELTGTPGSAPANDRAAGFRAIIKDNPDYSIVFSQTGEFERAKGKAVAEALLKGEFKDVNVIFAHNDDMALGAIQAIEEAGKVPGKDIIIISIDGVHDAFVAMSEGKLNCSVECNPLLGPLIMDACEKAVAGIEQPRRILMEDQVYDTTNAAAALPDRKY
ncbi:MAG: ABC transporter substrate-binding protein [Fimbriimonadaceae bacterium]|nr:ABC transporter substrate-binding protein [Fimbriimonadaceae bacterium]